jgi:hypothetical protein
VAATGGTAALVGAETGFFVCTLVLSFSFLGVAVEPDNEMRWDKMGYYEM